MTSRSGAIAAWMRCVRHNYTGHNYIWPITIRAMTVRAITIWAINTWAMTIRVITVWAITIWAVTMCAIRGRFSARISTEFSFCQEGQDQTRLFATKNRGPKRRGSPKTRGAQKMAPENGPTINQETAHNREVNQGHKTNLDSRIERFRVTDVRSENARWRFRLIWRPPAVCSSWPTNRPGLHGP